MDLCINTQTPLLQFATHLPGNRFEREWPPEVRLEDLREGEDYRYSPGGVTRMVYPMVRWLTAHGRIESAHWVALNPHGPRIVHLPGLVLHNLKLPTDRVGAYGRTKEAIWAAAHGTGELAPSEDLFWSDEFSEYAYYNRQCAEYIRGLDRREDFDLFYIHDFQQLQVGSMLNTLKPKLFRWHIPFESDSIPPAWRPVVAHHFRSYDTIIVSSDRYRRALGAFGHKGRIVRIYPYVDPADYGHPSSEQVAEVGARFGIPEGATVILLVGRMDPTKGQDRAIRAFARLGEGPTERRLVLVGNGSFSGSQGGLGLDKASRWRAVLERTAREADVVDRVVLTGHTTQAELDALYERAAFTLLPSLREGFGLVAVESWLHRRPVIVSRAAGVAELIEPGKNGFVVDPDDADAMARAMRRLLAGGEKLRQKMADAARPALEACSFESAMQAESRLLTELVVA